MMALGLLLLLRSMSSSSSSEICSSSSSGDGVASENVHMSSDCKVNDVAATVAVVGSM
jgi:hypothetical protein